MKISQEDRILEWLKRGNTLTPLQAYDLFGTLALHSRAASLRDRGEPIVCDKIKTPEGKRVGLYKYVAQGSLPL